jgi:23S rRNA (guanosine2251-2'-O)-methyltransferase
MKRILAGPHAVAEAVRAAPGNIQVILVAESMRPSSVQRIEASAKHSKVPLELVTKAILDTLAEEMHHQGVVAITGAYPYIDLPALLARTAKEPAPLVVVLDQVQDPHNLGAVMRSAYAFGAAGIIIPKDRAAPVTAATVRASAGASELIRTVRVVNLVRALEEMKDAGFQLYGAAMSGDVSLPHLSFDGPSVIVLGSEGRGLRRLTARHCDRLFQIPMLSDFDSLNVSAAAAIALYQASLSRLR